jgi:HEAT repeat protein
MAAVAAGPNYEGLTKAQVTRGLSGNAGDKCKCLGQIAACGEAAAIHLGYGPEVARCVKDPSRDVKVAALEALASMGAVGAPNVDIAASYIEDADTEVRCAAIAALGGIGMYSGKYEQEVAKLVNAQVPQVRAAAALALGGMKADRQKGVLKRCLSDEEPQVAAAALRGIGLLGEQGSSMASDVSGCLTHQDPDVRLAAITALTNFGENANKQANQVASCLSDDSNVVRQAAVAYFSDVPLDMVAYSVVPTVEKLLSNRDGRAQAAAAVALAKIQANHAVVTERLTRAREVDDGTTVLNTTGDLPKKAVPLSVDTQKLIALLSSDFEDDQVVALAAAGVEPKPSIELRRPACAAASTLGLWRSSEAIQPIAAKLSSTAPKEVTASFLAALGGMDELPAAVSSKVSAFLNDSAPSVRAGACLALGAGEESGADEVVAKLEDPHPTVRAAAAQGLGKMKAAKYSDQICTLLGDRVPKVQIAAMHALASLGQKGEVYAALIARCAVEGDVDARIAATKVLTSMGARGAAFAEEMTVLLEDPHPSVRKAGLDALAKMGEAAKPFLASAQSMTNDPSEEVRLAAEAAVTALK